MTRAPASVSATATVSGVTVRLSASPDTKETGAYYTPPAVVNFLVDWAIQGKSHPHVLDPSCGDGRFLAGLPSAVGVDLDLQALRKAKHIAAGAKLVHADFFDWSDVCEARFDAIVGNPPFVRFQRFAGEARERAMRSVKSLGVDLPGLSSSWAFFVARAIGLLNPGGRLAMVVPAEISYAVYARPLVKFLTESFRHVELFAPHQKLFPNLSEDCWLLRCDGFRVGGFRFKLFSAPTFSSRKQDWTEAAVAAGELALEQWRLRPFLLPEKSRRLYQALRATPGVVPFGEVARIGIGYVSGANDFFHLSRIEARKLKIPSRCLQVTVRSNADLAGTAVDESLLARWNALDRAVYLLRLGAGEPLPATVRKYLGSQAGRVARRAYKCRTRTPWYSVPDVRIPDAFLELMSGGSPRLIPNRIGASCTNSIHSVQFTRTVRQAHVYRAWQSPLARLSCEVEGHRLGGGLLKLEPTEARRVLLPIELMLGPREDALLERAIHALRTWG